MNCAIDLPAWVSIYNFPKVGVDSKNEATKGHLVFLKYESYFSLQTLDCS